MLNFPLMLKVKFPVLDRIQPQSNKFATSVGNEATGDPKLNDSPGAAQVDSSSGQVPFHCHLLSG